MAVFNAMMSTRIAEAVRDNYNEFFPSNKTAQYARLSQDAWQNLANQINGEFGSSVTVKQVQEKWHNMRRKSKEKFQTEKKHKLGTGGGSPKDEMDIGENSAHAIICNVLGETASFKGVPGGRSTPILPTAMAGAGSSHASTEDLEVKAFMEPPKKPKLEFGTPLGRPRTPTPITELQRTVLEMQIESQKLNIESQKLNIESQKLQIQNQKHLSNSMEKIDQLVDQRISPTVDKMNTYYSAKLCKTTKEGGKEWTNL